MNSNLKQKLILTLAKRKKNEGFTLIELLVVVIIIGILSAVALPNLLGQVGQARETEATNFAGSVNRAQQARYTEQTAFAAPADDAELRDQLGITIDFDFYETFDGQQGDEGEVSAFGDGAGAGALGTVAVNPIEPEVDNIRPIGGAVAFDTTDRTFSTVVCRENDTAAAAALNIGEMTGGDGDGTTAACGDLDNISGNEEEEGGDEEG